MYSLGKAERLKSELYDPKVGDLRKITGQSYIDSPPAYVSVARLCK